MGRGGTNPGAARERRAPERAADEPASERGKYSAAMNSAGMRGAAPAFRGRRLGRCDAVSESARIETRRVGIAEKDRNCGCDGHRAARAWRAAGGMAGCGRHGGPPTMSGVGLVATERPPGGARHPWAAATLLGLTPNHARKYASASATRFGSNASPPARQSPPLEAMRLGRAGSYWSVEKAPNCVLTAHTCAL